ncbi:MAG: PxKF domain-containing protein, partial [Deltaproteobacteria bacterium]|nr:PxKF domain-containing protein [Deltaproteobacteria bacterium]
PVPDWGFVGLLSPWQDNYSVKLGSAVPIKWYYTDSNGKADSSMADPKIEIYQLSSCKSDAVEDSKVVDVVNDPGSSGWKYNGDWQYNWETVGPDVTKGCYNVYITSQYTGQTNGEFWIRLR